MSDALSRCPGWMASMLLFAIFGTTSFVNALINQWINGPVASVIGVATWLTWGFVSCLAMSLGCIHAVGNVRRLGLRSVLRFQVWFELSRLSWHAAVLGFVVAATASFLAGHLNLKPVETIAWSAGKVTVSALFVVFACTGTIGYTFALIGWRIPTGRAFECVNFYWPLFVGGYFSFYAFDHWPPIRLWPDGIITASVGLFGIVILSVSFIISVYRMQQWETRVKANTRVGGDTT